MIRKILIVGLMILPVLANAESMAIVVAKDSAISSLSENEAQQLFSGQLRTLNGVSVQALDLPGGSAERDAFYHQLLGRNSSQMRSHWARLIFTGKASPLRATNSVAEMKSTVAGAPNMVGYLPKGDVTDRIKVILTVD